MDMELDREIKKYQFFLDTFDLGLYEVTTIGSVFYEVKKEYHDGRPEDVTDFIEFDDALKHFNEIINN